ncbi:MAG: FkbM family methyltransferase [Bacteroidota bacterium]
MKFKTKILNQIRKLFRNNIAEKIIIFLITQSKGHPLFEKLAPNHYQYSKGAIRKCKRDGINLVLDISDYLDHFIYFNFKDLSHNKLLSLIRPGIYFIDVGANNGFLSMKAFIKADGNIRIYSFEPDKINFQKIAHHLEINPEIEVHAINAALGDSEYFVKLTMPTNDNSGGIRIINKSKNIQSDNDSIPVHTLDDYIFTDKKIERADLIKIDVEGYELKVLKGAIKTLSEFQPTLFIEWDNNNLISQENSVYELFTFLKEFNYTIYDTVSNIEITHDNLIKFENIHTDILCIPQKN